MKKSIFLPVLIITLSIFTLASCSKIKQALQYDIPLQSGSVTIIIPPTSVANGSVNGTGTNTINIDSVIKASTANTLGVSNIISVKLTSVTLTLPHPDSANNFQNFESCYASFFTNAVSTPYEVRIANNPNSFASAVYLPVDSSVELKSYLNGNQFTYSAGGQLRTSTTDSLTCVISFTFNVIVQG